MAHGNETTQPEFRPNRGIFSETEEEADGVAWMLQGGPLHSPQDDTLIAEDIASEDSCSSREAGMNEQLDGRMALQPPVDTTKDDYMALFCSSLDQGVSDPIAGTVSADRFADPATGSSDRLGRRHEVGRGFGRIPTSRSYSVQDKHEGDMMGGCTQAIGPTPTPLPRCSVPAKRRQEQSPVKLRISTPQRPEARAPQASSPPPRAAIPADGGPGQGGQTRIADLQRIPRHSGPSVAGGPPSLQVSGMALRSMFGHLVGNRRSRLASSSEQMPQRPSLHSQPQRSAVRFDARLDELPQQRPAPPHLQPQRPASPPPQEMAQNARETAVEPPPDRSESSSLIPRNLSADPSFRVTGVCSLRSSATNHEAKSQEVAESLDRLRAALLSSTAAPSSRGCSASATTTPPRGVNQQHQADTAPRKRSAAELPAGSALEIDSSSALEIDWASLGALAHQQEAADPDELRVQEDSSSDGDLRDEQVCFSMPAELLIATQGPPAESDPYAVVDELTPEERPTVNDDGYELVEDPRLGGATQEGTSSAEEECHAECVVDLKDMDIISSEKVVLKHDVWQFWRDIFGPAWIVT